MLDTSKTGVIAKGDIKRMLELMQLPSDTHLAADLWAVLDQDGSGRITFDEFAPVYHNWARHGLGNQLKLQPTEREMRMLKATFDKLDVSRTGFLSKALASGLGSAARCGLTPLGGAGGLPEPE